MPLLFPFIWAYPFHPPPFPLPSYHVWKKVIFTLEFCPSIPKHMCPMMISRTTSFIYMQMFFFLRISSSDAFKKAENFSLTAEWISDAPEGRDVTLARDEKARENARWRQEVRNDAGKKKTKWNTKWPEEKKTKQTRYWMRERKKMHKKTRDETKEREKNSAKRNEKQRNGKKRGVMEWEKSREEARKLETDWHLSRFNDEK